jgi:hypothetical protein
MASPPLRQLESAPLHDANHHALRAFGWERYVTYAGFAWYHNALENVWSWTEPWARIFLQYDAPVMRSYPHPVERWVPPDESWVLDDAQGPPGQSWWPASHAANDADATLMQTPRDPQCRLHTVRDYAGTVWPDIPTVSCDYTVIASQANFDSKMDHATRTRLFAYEETGFDEYVKIARAAFANDHMVFNHMATSGGYCGLKGECTHCGSYVCVACDKNTSDEEYQVLRATWLSFFKGVSFNPPGQARRNV